MCICFPCTFTALLSFLLLRPLTQVNNLLGSPIFSFKFVVFWGVYIKTIAILLVLISYVFLNSYLIALIALHCFIL